LDLPIAQIFSKGI